MRHTDAKAQRPHRADVGHLVAQLREHLHGPGVVAVVDPLEARDVVRTALPLEAAEVDVVVDAEVVEGHEQVGGECRPQPQLVGSAPVEERPDVDAVGALRRGGQSEQLDRRQVVEQTAVGRRLGVVELVDDHDVEVVRRESVHPVRR